MAKWIKNDSGGNKTWVGQLVVDQAYYEIQSHEETLWSSNSVLLTDIASGDAIVAKSDSGTDDIADVNSAIDYLKDGSPKTVDLVTQTPSGIPKFSNYKAEGSSASLSASRHRWINCGLEATPD